MRQKCVLSGQLANNPAAALFRCFWVPCVQCALFGMLESIRILHWSYQCFMPLCGSAIWKGEEPWHDLLLSQTHHQRWSNIPFWIRSMSIPFILRLSLSLACFAPYQDWLTDYIILYIYMPHTNPYHIGTGPSGLQTEPSCFSWFCQWAGLTDVAWMWHVIKPWKIHQFLIGKPW